MAMVADLGQGNIQGRELETGLWKIRFDLMVEVDRSSWLSSSLLLSSLNTDVIFGGAAAILWPGSNKQWRKGQKNHRGESYSCWVVGQTPLTTYPQNSCSAEKQTSLYLPVASDFFYLQLNLLHNNRDQDKMQRDLSPWDSGSSPNPSPFSLHPFNDPLRAVPPSHFPRAGNWCSRTVQ